MVNGALYSRGSESTDWLGSRPIFFRTDLPRFASDCGMMIGGLTPEVDWAGLNTFCEFGYSVLGRTPFRDLSMVPPDSDVRVVDGRVSVLKSRDTFQEFVEFSLPEADILESLEADMLSWARQVDGEIAVPLSGGLDSRLLLWCLRSEKARLSAWTFGPTWPQWNSREVLIARAVASSLGVPWHRLELGDYFRYMNESFELNGPTTHAHGMYSFSFIDSLMKVRPDIAGVVSGLLGDVWAGSIPAKQISSPTHLRELGHAHGLHADPTILREVHVDDRLIRFYEDNSNLLRDYRFQLVTTARFKAPLLSHLVRAPESRGIKVATPFLSPRIAFALMNVPKSRRDGRRWMHEFFEGQGLSPRVRPLSDPKTISAYHAMSLRNPPALSVRLDAILDERVRQATNAFVSSPPGHVHTWMHFNTLARGARRALHRVEKWNSRLNTYLTLWPIGRALDLLSPR